MDYLELKDRLEKAKAEVNKLERLLKVTYPTPEQAQPGDKLADGCVVIERYPKTIFYNERLLIAAPEETQVLCEWTPEFKPVFDKLKEHGFNPSDWFIPSVEQLQMAYKIVKRHFIDCWYWSSAEASSIDACLVYFINGGQCSGSKTVPSWVRAFRFVEL
jgi:hypothetical protein